MTTTRGSIITPWGRLALEVGEQGLQRVRFDGPDYPPLTGLWAEALADYLAGQPIPLDLPVDLAGVSDFSRRALQACRAIPFGETRTYAELAAQLGRPGAARAVGQAMARNPVPIIIPCHRVLGTSGHLTGFAGGLPWKAALLAHEHGGR